MKHLAYLNKFFYKYRWRMIPGFIFVVVSNYFGIIPAQVIRIAFDLVKDNIALFQLFDGFERQSLIYEIFGHSLLLFGTLVLVLALIRGLFLFLMRQTIILTSRHIEYDLKNEIYDHYQQLDMAFFKRNNTGDLINRVTEDVSRVRAYLGPAIMYSINTVVLSIMVISSMFTVNAKLAIYALAPIPVLSAVILFINKLINKRSEKIQEQLSALSSFVQETFSGIRVIKTYSREQDKKNSFAKESNDYKTVSLSLVKVQAVFFPLILLLIGLSTIITIYIGGIEVMRGSISSGNIAEFIVYVNQLTFPAMSLAWVTSLVQRAAASQKRINEFLDTSPRIKSQTGGKEEFRGDIEFRNVSFTYPDTGITALKEISFKVNPGKILAIIGKTGSGKSTIARLLMRMYDTSSGTILVDGIPIQDLNLNSYRSTIGFVPQDVFLFSDTIAKNVAFGLDQLDMAKVEEATKKAAVYDNIMEFEKGFETAIGERGITLSGGQKQRVSIARAITINPKILIFDDCLSAVDTKTEEKILQNLGTVMRDRSAIFIAHRVSTIKNADHILVMENGQIIEEGKHTELLAAKGSYFELYEKQLLEEEV
ncbi:MULTISPECIES: ABC transporter ATP-binding protein [Olivibacter]|uniref:ABC transporter ATP-binding protein n=1 Tax=Olivibacter jilunii TaxID=985016 RepID=A0ABW6AVX1_9SPHI|nr:ABC transporter ATP-binding protein/permease [Olivibacter sp. UJ_SKK_5.1]MDX3914348.1 ABC transporter ATP-binding protein [Pseudosphingobacterium sp.]